MGGTPRKVVVQQHRTGIETIESEAAVGAEAAKRFENELLSYPRPTSPATQPRAAASRCGHGCVPQNRASRDVGQQENVAPWFSGSSDCARRGQDFVDGGYGRLHAERRWKGRIQIVGCPERDWKPPAPA